MYKKKHNTRAKLLFCQPNPVAFLPFSLSLLLGTLRYEDGDGRQNVAEKVNSRSFNLHRDYFKLLTLSNVDEPS